MQNMPDTTMLLAEQTLQQAATGQYEFAVTGGAMTSPVRQVFAAHFVQQLLQGLSCGEQLDQIQLKVIEREGSHGTPLPTGTGPFACETAVETRGRGAGGRYVFSASPVQVAKRGPVSQTLTSVVVSLTLLVMFTECMIAVY